jgi:hypothetical protein
MLTGCRRTHGFAHRRISIVSIPRKHAVGEAHELNAGMHALQHGLSTHRLNKTATGHFGLCKPRMTSSYRRRLTSGQGRAANGFLTKTPARCTRICLASLLYFLSGIRKTAIAAKLFLTRRKRSKAQRTPPPSRFLWDS